MTRAVIGPRTSPTEFQQRLQRAGEELIEAWKLRPDRPEAPSEMVGVVMGGGGPKGDTERLWFDRAVAAQFVRYDAPKQTEASSRYVAIAHAFGLDPATLALAFVNAQTFVTANIIGATSLDQLRLAVASSEVVLPDEARAAIERVYRELPDPCP